MPEGDTIWRTAAALRERLLGRRVERAEPASLARLRGARVESVEPAGKHLTIGFDNRLALHTHMRMTGSWHLYLPGEAWRRPARQARALLDVGDCVAVLFNAPVVELHAASRSRTSHLGPDLLDPGVDIAAVVRRARSHGARAIGEVLLDQTVAAGIGNVYRCEALWARRVDPWTSVDELDDEDLRALYDTARAAMSRNLGPGGWDRRFPGYGRGAVHGRGGLPCRRCGNRVRVRAQGEHARLTYWCPGCQAPPGSRPPAAGATPG